MTTREPDDESSAQEGESASSNDLLYHDERHSEHSSKRRDPGQRETKSGDDERGGSKSRWDRDIMRAGTGGVVALVLGVVLSVVLGSVSPYKARTLADSLSDTLSYFGSAGIGASSTILALMITLLGLSNQSDHEFNDIFYRRVLWSGRQASVLFLLCVVLLLVMAMPTTSTELPYESTVSLIQFYATALITSMATGLFVSLVLFLQSTVSDLVAVLRKGKGQIIRTES